MQRKKGWQWEEAMEGWHTWHCDASGTFCRAVAVWLAWFVLEKTSFHADKWNFWALVEVLLSQRSILVGVSLCSYVNLCAAGVQQNQSGRRSQIPSYSFIHPPWVTWAGAPVMRLTACRDMQLGQSHAVIQQGVSGKLEFSPGPSDTSMVCLCWFYLSYP